jgi:large subunit ribosomal protein L35
MPKQRTRKSLVKRFRVTKTGKVLRTQGFKRHLNVKKSQKRKRRLSGMVLTDAVHARKIRKVLGK